VIRAVGPGPQRGKGTGRLLSDHGEIPGQARRQTGFGVLIGSGRQLNGVQLTQNIVKLSR
jgi:hypothetical protein